MAVATLHVPPRVPRSCIDAVALTPSSAERAEIPHRRAVVQESAVVTVPARTAPAHDQPVGIDARGLAPRSTQGAEGAHGRAVVEECVGSSVAVRIAPTHHLPAVVDAGG